MITEERDPTVALVHIVGMITNKNRRDGKMVGAAATVIPIAWNDATNHDQAYELGESIGQYDVDSFGISLAGRAILSYSRAEGQARHFINTIPVTVSDQRHSEPQLTRNTRTRTQLHAHVLVQPNPLIL